MRKYTYTTAYFYLMRKNTDIVGQVYGNQLRVRVIGICEVNGKILMVKHRGLGSDGIFYMPPGGGMRFGESAMDCLKREFAEESGIMISVGQFICVTEYLETPLHALELFFTVSRKGGVLKKGKDPEMGDKDQIIEKVEFMSYKRLNKIPYSQLHSLLHHVNSFSDIVHKQGYSYISG